MGRNINVTAAVIGAALAGAAVAAAAPDEIKTLGSTRMLWGAEKAGNKDGTIPEWTGAVTPPPTFDPKTPTHRPDPFANEKPLLSIDAKNVDKYADKLSEGTKAMLKKYSTYRLDIYPSHRTANYPKYYLDNTLKNASQCKTVSDGLKLEGCWPGLPFPFPKTGNEVVWNRLLKFDAPAFTSVSMMRPLRTPPSILTAPVPASRMKRSSASDLTRRAQLTRSPLLLNRASGSPLVRCAWQRAV